MLPLLVAACTENPFEGWQDRIDSHDRLRMRIAETSGMYARGEGLDELPTRSPTGFTRSERTPSSTAFPWTPGQTLDITLSVYDGDEFEDVTGLAYRFATDGWVMASEPMDLMSFERPTMRFQLPADACADISAQCLSLPFEQFLVVARTNGEPVRIIPVTPVATVSIMCRSCTGSDCEEASEC